MKTINEYIKKAKNNRNKSNAIHPVFYNGDNVLVIGRIEMLKAKVIESQSGDVNRKHHVCVCLISKGHANYGEQYKTWVNKFDLFLS